jgi:hypothetical protein
MNKSIGMSTENFNKEKTEKFSPSNSNDSLEKLG